MVDEDMGRFLRSQANWVTELADLIDAHPSAVQPGNAADALALLARTLLVKAHEVDGKGVGPLKTIAAEPEGPAATTAPPRLSLV